MTARLDLVDADGSPSARPTRSAPCAARAATRSWPCSTTTSRGSTRVPCPGSGLAARVAAEIENAGCQPSECRAGRRRPLVDLQLCRDPTAARPRAARTGTAVGVRGGGDLRRRGRPARSRAARPVPGAGPRRASASPSTALAAPSSDAVAAVLAERRPSGTPGRRSVRCSPPPRRRRPAGTTRSADDRAARCWWRCSRIDGARRRVDWPSTTAGSTVAPCGASWPGALRDRTPPPPLFLFGWASWRSGNGALAAIAVRAGGGVRPAVQRGRPAARRRSSHGHRPAPLPRLRAAALGVTSVRRRSGRRSTKT